MRYPIEYLDQLTYKEALIVAYNNAVTDYEISQLKSLLF